MREATAIDFCYSVLTAASSVQCDAFVSLILVFLLLLSLEALGKAECLGLV